MAKFYKCDECGSIVLKLNNLGPVPVCCGQSMRELAANSTDAATEKHVPVVKEEGNTVEIVVGSAPHPMIHYLHPGEAPACRFALTDDEVAIAAYAYCNKHGLWKADVE